MVQRPPTIGEAEEIYELTLYLYSFSSNVPLYKMTDFFVISNALTYTGLELGMTDLESKTTNWAGLYHYEEDCFFIHSIEDSQGVYLQINLLSHLSMPYLYLL
ncbi:MAG: hypothetical protein WD555_02755 [Fulvivirga sp.]